MQQILESLSVLFISPLKDNTAALLWCIFLAVLLALGYTLLRRGKMKTLLLRLKELGAVSAETAKTAEELGVRMPEEKTLRAERLVEVGENDDGEAIYFLPPDREKKVEAVLKTGSLRFWPTVGGIVGLYALLVLAYHLLPLILDGFSAL